MRINAVCFHSMASRQAVWLGAAVAAAREGVSGVVSWHLLISDGAQELASIAANAPALVAHLLSLFSPASLVLGVAAKQLG